MRERRRYVIGAGIVLGLGVGAIASAPGVPAVDYARFSLLTPAGPAEPPPDALKRLPRFAHAKHKIGKNEDIRSIASAYGTDVRSLQGTNNNEFIFMSRGGAIRVHNGKGVLYQTTAAGETLNGIARRFKKSDADLDAFKAEIVKENRLPPTAVLKNYTFAKGDRVHLPLVYVDLDTYRLPVNSFSGVSSRFGMRFHPVLKRRIFHKGCDIPMPLGTPVHPSRSGTVVYSGYKSGYGNVVEVRHSDGSVTRYGHLASYSVAVGQTVQKSKSVLGKVGSSGMSTGPHLHFEIITRSGQSINPMAKIGKR